MTDATSLVIDVPGGRFCQSWFFTLPVTVTDDLNSLNLSGVSIVTNGPVR